MKNKKNNKLIDKGCQTKNLNFWIKTSFIH